MPTALIADDERLMRDQLRARLADVWPDLEVIGEARNGQEAVTLTEQHHPDIVFLDIRMPGLTGIEAARLMAQLPTHDDAQGWPGCEVVFITAYDQYAVEAFEQGVVDYVLKPAEPRRLQLTVERLKHRLAARQGNPDEPAPMPLHTPDMQVVLQKLSGQMAAPPKARLQWIQASVGATLQMIPVEDVLFFISDEKYTRVKTAQLEALIRKPIKELLEELDMTVFWQIHRSTLVNTRAIAGVTRDMHGRQRVLIKGCDEKLEVSRSYTGLFKSM